ncbi:unnamed protein product [Paramecium octaurelia]|uniref:Tetratricopeptide repeat protein n=1 Tax=Paramecium octaurelia TaxID=43137 RepID=A0A8S1YPC5_PAROT|nr:unnamed protein product [Paramecium octaurelia]
MIIQRGSHYNTMLKYTKRTNTLFFLIFVKVGPTQLGISLDYLQKYKESISQYDQALKLNPLNQEAFKYKCIRYKYIIRNFFITQLGLNEKSIQCCNYYMELNQQDTEIYYRKGMSLQFLNQCEEALTFYDQALQFTYQSIQNNQVLNHHSSIVKAQAQIPQWLKNQYQDTISSYNEFLQQNPNIFKHLLIKQSIKMQRTFEALNGKGISLHYLKRYQLALDYFVKALKVNASKIKALVNKGICLAQLDRYSEAIVCYDKAILISKNQLNYFIQKDITFFYVVDRNLIIRDNTLQQGYLKQQSRRQQFFNPLEFQVKQLEYLQTLTFSDSQINSFTQIDKIYPNKANYKTMKTLYFVMRRLKKINASDPESHIQKGILINNEGLLCIILIDLWKQLLAMIKLNNWTQKISSVIQTKVQYNFSRNAKEWLYR